MTHHIAAIDPGPKESGFVHLQIDGPDSVTVLMAGTFGNEMLEDVLSNYTPEQGIEVAIEMIGCYGMAVGQSVFDTAIQIGSFKKCLRLGHIPLRLYFRREVKLTLCGNVRAKDTNIKQQIIDMFGGKDRAIGGSKCLECHGKKVRGRNHAECTQCEGTGFLYPPGPLYEVKSHAWSALAIGLTNAIARGYLTSSAVIPSSLCKNSPPIRRDISPETPKVPPIAPDTLP